MHLMVGGRHLGDPGDPAAEFELAIDGQVRDRWAVTVDQRNFFRFLDLPEGVTAGNGAFAHLTIVSHAAGGNDHRAAAAVRQFDIQSADQIIAGFAEGWHEDEYDVATGLHWRWTSEKSVIRVNGPSHTVRLTIRGENPLRYFDTAPTVRVTAGGRVVAERKVSDDFEWSVLVPADDVARSEGAIAIETDRTYLPGVAEGSGDERHLALRLFECRIDQVSD
jgi:hypothetical protein